MERVCSPESISSGIIPNWLFMIFVILFMSLHLRNQDVTISQSPLYLGELQEGLLIYLSGFYYHSHLTLGSLRIS